MANELPDYSDKVVAAVASYWDVRTSQAKRSVESGAINTGLRAEVTGGRHLDALELLLIDVLVGVTGGDGGEDGAAGVLPQPARSAAASVTTPASLSG